MQTFSDLIREDYLYIDKTREIYKLLGKGGKYYFLSRPRRFGKSLLVSVLKEIFSGNKELFKELWIYDKIDWKSYPVIHIDFSNVAYETPDLLKKSLEETLEEIGYSYGLQFKSVNYKTRFAKLIKKLSDKNKDKVVLLIDEYDKPIIDFIDRPNIASKNRDILKTFYETVKAADRYIKFAFLTGVSKFSRVSVFSGLNNLKDITLSDKFPTILGCTEEELLHYFKDRIADLVKTGVGPLQSISREELLNRIRHWYNGYSWDGSNFVYNPHSILHFFDEKQFDNYWFSTATPTFLIKIIKEKEIDIKQLENAVADTDIFESYDIGHMDITALLFQTGYLTVKKRTFDPDGARLYHLSYPNKEVSDSFLKYLFNDFTVKDSLGNSRILRQLKSKLSQKDIPGFFMLIQSVFASLPYNIFVNNREAYYQTVIYLLLKLAGARIQPEMETNIGRIDAVIETDKTIFIMEFKIDSEQDALKQIKEKKYYQSYLSSGKEIILIGVGFDTENRNIGNYVTENLEINH
jgi:hypothetical protein